MIIMGLDPGTATTGFGFIKKENDRFFLIDYGCIKTEAGLQLPQRLKEIDAKLNREIKKHRPEVIAVEEIFFFKNAKTVISVSQARGVILARAARAMVDVKEYTPLQIKQAITGYGRADKSQVQKMVKMILNLKEIPRPDDAADALACAICCANSLNNFNS